MFNTTSSVLSAILLIVIATQTTISYGLEATFHRATRENNRTGDNQIWMFHRGNQNYFMTNSQASDNYTTRGRYNISAEGEELVSIRISGGSYIVLNKVKLTLTIGVSSDRSIFKLVPTNGDSKKFHLYANDTPLVTPSSRPPFLFYSQVIYPTEPPAEFSLSVYELSIEESYAGQRSNIRKTAQLIQDSTIVNKSVAYSELLKLMAEFEHIHGSEIFEVGQYIIDDLGLNDDLFKLLPTTVQLLFSSEPLTLQYKQKSTNLTFPMKYNWASDLHQNILSYSFSFDGWVWAITYANEHQLYIVPSDGSDNLFQVLSPEKIYIFQSRLSLDLESVEIYSFYHNPAVGTRYYPLRATTSNPDFYFARYYTTTGNGDNFVIRKYVSVD